MGTYKICAKRMKKTPGRAGHQHKLSVWTPGGVWAREKRETRTNEDFGNLRLLGGL